MLQTRLGGAASPRVAPRLLKVREVAERLGVSTATVYALCKRGALRHVRVANAIRVPEAALLAFLG
jgi:excisionase family DNA binding protein